MNQRLLHFLCVLCISISSVLSSVALANGSGFISTSDKEVAISGQQLFEQASQLIEQKKIARGVDLLHKSAEHQHLNAILELASFYELGLGVIQNDKKAIEYYERAVKMGSSTARFNLALLLVNPENQYNKLIKARSLMRPLAEEGDIEAQYSLSVMYMSIANGVPANSEKSLHWLRLAADSGHVDAEFNLGLHYFKGKKLARNLDKAFHWFNKAAGKNMPKAQFNLALMYEKGLGVEANQERSLQWYQSAAKLGNAGAQQNLGIKYLLGKGLEYNKSKGLELISRAAKQHHKNAEFLLAHIYQTGSHGIEKDIYKAKKLYRLSAKQGKREAQYELALMLSKVEDNHQEAKYWAYQASFAGDEKAYQLVTQL